MNFLDKLRTWWQHLAASETPPSYPLMHEEWDIIQAFEESREQKQASVLQASRSRIGNEGQAATKADGLTQAA